MSTFALRQPGLHPTALRGPWGVAFGASFGAAKDVVVTYAKLAVKAGFVLLAPDDALVGLGADVALEQLPFEGTDLYRTRIAAAWDTWPWAGTRTAVETVADQLDFHGVYIFTAREWGVPDAATLWARWWVLVTLDDPFASDGAWDDAGTWDDGGTWDSDAPPEAIATMRRLFRRFANARDRGAVRFSLSSTDYYDDGGVWGDGSDPDDLWADDPAFFEVEI